MLRPQHFYHDRSTLSHLRKCLVPNRKAVIMIFITALPWIRSRGKRWMQRKRPGRGRGGPVPIGFGRRRRHSPPPTSHHTQRLQAARFHVKTTISLLSTLLTHLPQRLASHITIVPLVMGNKVQPVSRGILAALFWVQVCGFGGLVLFCLDFTY